jgi:hypothetical protein
MLVRYGAHDALLEQPYYPYDELVIARAITGGDGIWWRVAFSQPRYLARP